MSFDLTRCFATPAPIGPFPDGPYFDDISRALDGADNLRIVVTQWQGWDAPTPKPMTWRQARATLDGKVRDTFDAVLRWAIDFDHLKVEITDLHLLCPSKGSPRAEQGAIKVDWVLGDYGPGETLFLTLERGELIYAPRPPDPSVTVLQDEVVFEVTAPALPAPAMRWPVSSAYADASKALLDFCDMIRQNRGQP